MEKLFKPRILNSLTQSWKIWAMGHINIFHKPCTDPGDSSLDCHSTAASAQLSVFFQQSCTPPIDTMWSQSFRSVHSGTVSFCWRREICSSFRTLQQPPL